MNKVASESQNLKEQKDDLARKLDKANRDNVLLMQIIQKSGEATSIPTAANNLVFDINKTSSMNNSTNK